ncbi:MAG: acyltransferase [Cyclobacteriaceae bacterium]|nr:acyltransferase [Cyclobacteriaceae bacterium]
MFYGRFYQWIIRTFPLFKPVYETSTNESPIFFRQWFRNRILGPESGPYWPIHKTSTVIGSWRNVHVGIDAAPGISPGCYILALGKVYIDDYVQIASNVGILSANHFMLDIRDHILSEIRIGKYSRIGMGSIIHPGVVLGDFTTVAAGSVVTKSFPEGYCVISGNPAELVKEFKDERVRKKFLLYQNKFEYNGFIPHEMFESFKAKYLNP